ncbi:MAG: NAD(P)H-hydrate dehydratase [Actinomycetota bacterium]|nr:NAD(P)H-hydrate dehydratase [Actinomycetota bacterium]
MIPVVTPDEMKAVDQAAPEPTEVLVRRAGASVARAALRLLGGGYGRRVVVVAGKGNNGADGRAAAERLRRRGARVVVIPAAEAPARVPPCHLVVDAAYGTGLHGDYRAPDPAGAPVVAVDIPSGVDGLTGQAGDGAVSATATVTFAALKPGLLLGDGPGRAGGVEVVDIGLDVSGARTHLVEDADVRDRLPQRPREAHKWQTAVFVVAGSPGMMGAPVLASRAAMRAGAGYVQLGVPGAPLEHLPAGSEVVGVALPREGWAAEVLRQAGRAKALVVGPGLGRAEGTLGEVRRLLEGSPVPVVVDGDGLAALHGAQPLQSRRVVLTPHDGEFERLAGAEPGPDRIGDTRALAADTGAVVLLKGPTTVVAGPGGDVFLSTSGSPRLATAGTGDVLCGVIAAFVAQGTGALWGAALGAHAHGAAAALGPSRGLVAGDLVDLVAAWLSDRA